MITYRDGDWYVTTPRFVAEDEEALNRIFACKHRQWKETRRTEKPELIIFEKCTECSATRRRFKVQKRSPGEHWDYLRIVLDDHAAVALQMRCRYCGAVIGEVAAPSDGPPPEELFKATIALRKMSHPRACKEWPKGPRHVSEEKKE